MQGGRLSGLRELGEGRHQVLLGARRSARMPGARRHLAGCSDRKSLVSRIVERARLLLAGRLRLDDAGPAGELGALLGAGRVEAALILGVVCAHSASSLLGRILAKRACQ